MKVIGKDNLNREEVADIILLENVSKEECENFKDNFINKYTINKGTESESYTYPYYPFIVEDSYRLWRGMEEFI